MRPYLHLLVCSCGRKYLTWMALALCVREHGVPVERADSQPEETTT